MQTLRRKVVVSSAAFLFLLACTSYRAIERSEGQLPVSARFIVLTSGTDELSLAGDVRNVLRNQGEVVVTTLQEATHNVNLTYATSNNAGNVRIDRLSIDVVEPATQRVVARYHYDRNNENTRDWTLQVKRLIQNAITSLHR
jgi:hypothetical protein